MRLTKELLIKLEKEIPVFGEQSVSGDKGGKGTKENPYTEEEYMAMVESGTLSKSVYYKTEEGSLTCSLPLVECTSEVTDFVENDYPIYNDHKPSGFWAMMLQMFSLAPGEPLLARSEKEKNVVNQEVAAGNPLREENEKGMDFLSTLAGTFANTLEGVASELDKYAPKVKMKMFLPIKALQQKEVLNVVQRASGASSTVISGVSLGYTACTGKFDKFIKEAGVAGCLMELSFYCPYTWAIGIAYGVYTIWSEMESE